MTTYILAEGENGISFNGGALDLWQCKSPEVILSGPAECGKTIAALHKLDALMWKYPRSQAAIIRKIYASIKSSVIPSYEKKVLTANTPVTKYGGESVQFFEYPNGSRIWVFGMDKPEKLLSSELDYAYVNQCEDLTLNDWETLTTRVTGRAGNSPYAQVFGDCNPAQSTHWILQRSKSGELKLFNQRHEDNPFLFDQDTGEWTEQGLFTISRLDALTGVRKKRLRYGQWASAEGMIYEDYNPSIHIIDPFTIPADWRRVRAIDFGYTHPFVCLWGALDGDGRLYIYRQIYRTGRLVETHAENILRLSEGEQILDTVADSADAGARAILANKGIDTIKAKKAVLAGIQAVQSRLKVAGDGKPRLFILRDSLVEPDKYLKQDRKPYRLEDEFEGYVWALGKEQPVKNEDDGLDALRYMCMFLTNEDAMGVTFTKG